MLFYTQAHLNAYIEPIIHSPRINTDGGKRHV